MSKAFSIVFIFTVMLVSVHISGGQWIPSQGKYKTLQEHEKGLQESDIEDSRTSNPTRKASENKKPWAGPTLQDMENTVTEPHDINWKSYEWPDPEDNPPDPKGGPRDWNYPGDIPFGYPKGCVLNCPASVTNCDQPFQ